MQIRPYAETDAAAWDRLCAGSPCASFLHSRGFLSYHGDRFRDRSVLVTDGDRWLGVLAAAEHPTQPGVIESHPGITYGGLVHDGSLRGQRMLDALSAIAAFYAAQSATLLRYKPLPHIYQRAPAQDDLYALFRLTAKRSRCELSCCIDLAHAWPVSERRRRSIAKARKAGLRYTEGAQHAAALWKVIDDNLQRKHAAQPVHSLADISLLAERFPAEIGFQVALLDDAVVAGTVTFRVGPVLHLQYIAAGEPGHAVAALDGLFDHLIDKARRDGLRYVDFGTSNEDQGRVLNDGLYRFKSEFGGGGVACETYEIDLK